MFSSLIGTRALASRLERFPIIPSQTGDSPLFLRGEGGRMLLPSPMTQGGGIRSDSQRITYTPAARRKRGGTAPWSCRGHSGERAPESGGCCCYRSEVGRTGRMPQTRRELTRVHVRGS